MTTLSTFIRTNTEQILAEWETFARRLPIGGSMTTGALRDHAHAMLDVIARDLESPQTPAEQERKASGALDEGHDRRELETAAAAHGSGRAESGFSTVQMVAEFRALRASVIRLWLAGRDHAGADVVNDMIRFNEAIDQMIAESLDRYTSDNEQTNGRFLAILGHDLRTPLGAIITSTQFMLDTGGLPEPHLGLVQGIARSSRRMNQLVADLLDLALTRLGDTIPISPAPMDAAHLLDDVVAEVSAYFPATRLELATHGDLRGEWDCPRLMQAIVNLVTNAVQHGAPGEPVAIEGRDDGHGVVLSVRNQGPPIPRAQLDGIFEAMKADASGRRDRRHLGLGLYIVEKIVVAHGGTIDLESTAERGTVIAIHLPRTARGDAPQWMERASTASAPS